MRHIIVHDYEDVLIEVVVDTARRDIPQLRSAIETILREAGEDVS
ncbi:HepT-like ribonuclease domain-containing protein [Fulvimarina sp. MAC8]